MLSHDGPISGPEGAQYIQDNVTDINGFYRSSSMERLVEEVAITEQTKNFYELR